MKIKQFLTEATSSLKPKDIQMLKKMISKPKKTSFVLQSFAINYDEDERVVEVVPKGNSVTFMFNGDLYDLTNELIDLADSMGYRFKPKFERPTNTQYFTVIK